LQTKDSSREQAFSVMFPASQFSEEIFMKHLLCVLLMVSASLAFAHCPNAIVCEMKAIDSTLPTTKLEGEALEKVKTLRAEGEKLYNEGKEKDALKILREAKKLLVS
jgi:arabinogalactan endo-1,4-beta-galactosidase